MTGTICHKRKSTHFQSFYWNDCFTQISDFPPKDINLARDSWFKLRLFYLNDMCGFYSRKREILNLTCNLELVFSGLVGNRLRMSCGWIPKLERNLGLFFDAIVMKYQLSISLLKLFWIPRLLWVGQYKERSHSSMCGNFQVKALSWDRLLIIFSVVSQRLSKGSIFPIIKRKFHFKKLYNWIQYKSTLK